MPELCPRRLAVLIAAIALSFTVACTGIIEDSGYGRSSGPLPADAGTANDDDDSSKPDDSDDDSSGSGYDRPARGTPSPSGSDDGGTGGNDEPSGGNDEPSDPDGGGGGSDPEPEPDPTMDGPTWCDVAAVMQAHCTGCHGDPPAGAPLPLVTYEQLIEPSGGGTVADRVVARMNSTSRPMPPSGSPVPYDEIAIVEGWIAAGQPYERCN